MTPQALPYGPSFGLGLLLPVAALLLVFQALSLGETVEQTDVLFVAPNCLQNKVLDRIDQEIKLTKEGKKGYLGFKLNSLTDKRIIDKLIEASQAGVQARRTPSPSGSRPPSR